MKKNSELIDILFIAYYFPPAGGSGMLRSLKFVKYLPEFGFRPIVLTVDPTYTRGPKDVSALEEIPGEAIIYRTPTLDWSWLFKALWGIKLNRAVDFLNKHILLPDPQRSWLPFLKIELDKIYSKHNIKAAFITGGPFSSFLIAPYLKDKHHIPYILDFRDDWTGNPFKNISQSTKRAVQQEEMWERQAVENAAGLSVLTPSIYDRLAEQYLPSRNTPFAVIPNGYDEADFIISTAEQKSRDAKTVHITYTGSFYGNRQPSVFWEALSQLIDEGRIDRSLVSIDIYGKNTPAFVLGSYKHNNHIRDMVHFLPYQSHREMISTLRHTDALLLFIAPGKEFRNEYTGKIFEYIRSETPILAFVPIPGLAADIINQSKTGEAYDPVSLAEVKRGFMSFYDKWQANSLSIAPNMEYIRTFERKSLTGKLAGLISEVIEER